MRTVGVLRALHAFLIKPPTVFYRFLRFSVKTVTVIGPLRLVLRKTVTVIGSLRLILQKTVTVIGSLRLVLRKNDSRPIAAVVAHVSQRTVGTAAPPML